MSSIEVQDQQEQPLHVTVCPNWFAVAVGGTAEPLALVNIGGRVAALTDSTEAMALAHRVARERGCPVRVMRMTEAAFVVPTAPIAAPDGELS